MKKIDPDEIFLDSFNLPHFNVRHLEGRLEKPIAKSTFYFLGLTFVFLIAIFLGKIGNLQINHGLALAERSEKNALRQTPIFAERGLIKDRNGVELAWNNPESRQYLNKPGFGHLLGYLSYPTTAEIATKKYDPKEPVGRAGLEAALNAILQGTRGIKMEETDVSGKIISEHVWRQPAIGQTITTTIDSRLQEKMFSLIDDLLVRGLFKAGAGVILDVKNGELIALVSAPEVDPNILTKRNDPQSIAGYLNDKSQPFLNRALRGLYTPGSVVKPFMAVAALNEKIITPEKKIYAGGTLNLPNPFVPGTFSVFKDWKVHGWVDLRQALAVSSDIYFYVIGGGFENQKGLGIAAIDRYAQLFGLGQPTGFNLMSEEVGQIPTPEWKEKNFPGDPWRIGDTYHTVIGQYGFQVTPLQMARAIAAIATSGELVTPVLLKNSPVKKTLMTNIEPVIYQIVREGLRLSVTEGTALGLNLPDFNVAAKTGTAELGASKEQVNSWTIGFFPYENPRYAFAVVLERGRATNLIGGVFVMRQVLDWLAANAPEYWR